MDNLTWMFELVDAIDDQMPDEEEGGFLYDDTPPWDSDPEHDYSVATYMFNTTGDEPRDTRRRNLQVGWNY